MTKPYWADECNHGVDTYIGSFEHDNQLIDVYVFDGLDPNEACLRFGNDPPDYYSPGTIDGMMYRNIPLYKKALELITDGGYKPKRNLIREMRETSSMIARGLCILNKIENGTETDGVNKLRDLLVNVYTNVESISKEI